MPIQVSYPGVYVSAITTPQPPTGGASTSIAAFVGRAPRGPTNQAVSVLNYAAYASTFGGLTADSAISYQANAFFSNGGSQGVVVRLYSAPASTTVTIGGAPVAADTYTLNYSIDGVPQAPVTGSGATQAAVATSLQGTLHTAITSGALLNLVTSAISTTNTSEIDIKIVTGATAVITFSAVATSTNRSAAGTIMVAAPSTIAYSGSATIPLSTQVNVTVAGTAIKDVYTLMLTPPGGRATNVSFTATTAVPGDVATGLAASVNGNTAAAALVTATANAAVVTLTYLTAVEVTGQVVGAGTLTLATSTPLFSLQAANPGLWGDELIASIVTVPPGPIYQTYNLNPSIPTQALFNLAISYFNGTGYQTESFLNVTLYGDVNQTNRLDVVLANGSQYVVWIPTTPPAIPNSPTTIAAGFAAGGADSAPLQDMDYIGNAAQMTGLYMLNQMPYGFNILCVPPDDVDNPDGQGGTQNADVYQEAAQICVANNAMLIIDPPTTWYAKWQSGQVAGISIDDLGSYTDDQARNSAVYFPRVVIADPLMNGAAKILPPCGFMAAAWASTDNASGVWKAPAGLDVPIGGITGLQANLNDDDNGALNPQGINVLRSFKTGGDVVWGARTLRGSDVLADEYKYLPVRRLCLFIETTLLEDTQWAVFQPNGPALWSQLQTQISTIMGNLFSQGAFAGTSASQAFFVKCDATTTTPVNQAAGIVNVQVGFAPLYPAEFVVITVSQQSASQSG